jgi:ABC-type multidrug transport system permease subunit
MRFLWTSAWKDFVGLRRDPLSLAIPVAIPLILGVLLSIVFARDDATPQGRLLVADEDSTFASNLLIGAFSREPLSKMVLVERVSRGSGQARINSGDGSAFLIIPGGFQDAVFKNQPFRLSLFRNPSQQVLPKIIEETLNIMVESEFYLHQVAGNQLRSFANSGPPTDAQIAQSSVAINHVANGLQKYLNPPLIRLDTAISPDRLQQKSFAAIFFPSMIFMASLFIANALSADIWKDRNSGTLRRLCTTPARLGAFLGGRVVFVVLVLLSVALAGVLSVQWLASVPVANPPAAVLWLACAGTLFFLLLLLLTLQASTQRGANVTANLVIFPLMMVGGSFFPFEVMPDWMAKFGAWTPNGWAVIRFKAIVDGTNPAGSLFGGAISLALLSTAVFLLILRRLRAVASA